MDNKESLFNRGFIMVFLSSLLMQMGHQSIQTLLPKYVNSLGAASTLVGLVSGTFAVAALAIRPFASPAFDIIKKKTLIRVGLVLLMITFTIYYFAPSIEIIIAGRVLHGFGIGSCAPLFLSYACTMMPESQIGRGVSLFLVSTAVGQAIGPGIGLSLAASIGYRNVFLLAVGCEILSFICLTITPSDPQPEKKPYRISLKTIIAKDALPAAALSCLITISYGCINSFLAIYAGLKGIDNIGLFFTINAIGLIVLRPILGGYIDKLGFRKAIVPCVALFMVTLACLGRINGTLGIVICAVMMASSYGLTVPAIQAMSIKSVSKEQRGLASNTLYVGTDTGHFLGPYIAGIVVDALIAGGMAEIESYSTMFMIMTIPSAIVIALIFVFTRQEKVTGE